MRGLRIVVHGFVVSTLNRAYLKILNKTHEIVVSAYMLMFMFSHGEFLVPVGQSATTKLTIFHRVNAA